MSGAARRSEPRSLLAAALPFLLVLLALSVSCAPRWRPRSIQVSLEPDVVERGRYLANHVAICITCHSERDYAFFGAPPKPGTEGRGGLTIPELFRAPPGLVIPAPNLTPAALGDWTDGEIYRAIAGGISKDGRSLFPAHPFSKYRSLPTEDIEAIIAYLRTLPPQQDELPERYLKYRSLEALVRTWPSPPPARRAPAQPGSRRYSKALMDATGCMWCHSPQTRLAAPIPGRKFSGGVPFDIPAPGGGLSWSTNLTPATTGLGAWPRETFIARFKRATPEAMRAQQIAPGGFSSLMPWEAYSGMTEEDLGILYDALRRLRPIENPAPRWTPPEQ